MVFIMLNSIPLIWLTGFMQLHHLVFFSSINYNLVHEVSPLASQTHPHLNFTEVTSQSNLNVAFRVYKVHTSCGSWNNKLSDYTGLYLNFLTCYYL